MGVSSYRDLLVWQKAMDFVVGCYRLTEPFPKSELYGLTSQLRRCAVSVPSNIAEGHGRYHTGDFLHHLSFAHGSLCEAETQLVLAERLGYAPPEAVAPLLDSAGEVGRMLNGLAAALERKLDGRS